MTNKKNKNDEIVLYISYNDIYLLFGIYILMLFITYKYVPFTLETKCNNYITNCENYNTVLLFVNMITIMNLTIVFYYCGKYFYITILNYTSKTPKKSRFFKNA